MIFRRRRPAPPRTVGRWHRGIRMRVVVGYVVMVAAALGIAVLVTWQVLLARLDRTIDLALAQEVEELRLLAGGTDPESGEPFGTDVESLFEVFMTRSVPADDEAYYTFVDGTPFMTSFGAPEGVFDDDMLIDAWASTTAPTRLDTTTTMGEVRSLAVPLASDGAVAGVFVVAFFPDDERSEILLAVRVVALAGAVVLVISAVVAWSLAGRVLRPVRQMTGAARSINEADLSGRFPVQGHDELSELGQTFNDMMERLEVGFRTQRQFLDDVAHELRTPITIAQGHLDLLGDVPDEVDDTVEIVRDELDRMSRYVSDLLVLAKAEQPDFLRLEPVDLRELADTVFERVSGLGPRRWVCDAAPPPGRLATIADAGRLEQALLNLAGNAVQHTDPDAEIGIGIAEVMHGGRSHVDLWVRDTGAGVDPDVIDTLFRRHTRGANRREARGDGMGIGLSIVDVIARAHHGSVRVNSLPQLGATFTISIPLDTGDSLEQST